MEEFANILLQSILQSIPIMFGMIKDVFVYSLQDPGLRTFWVVAIVLWSIILLNGIYNTVQNVIKKLLEDIY